MKIFPLVLLAALQGLFLSRPREAVAEAAAAASPLSPPLSMAFGGAGSASFREDFSYLLNPAALGFHRKSKSAIAYTAKGGRQAGVLSFMDLRSGLPVSLTYRRFWSSRFLKSDEDHFSAAAGAAMARWLSMGVTVRRIKEAGREKPLWNGDIGSLFRLGRGMGLAFTLKRLLVNERGSAREGVLGLYLNRARMFQGYADASYSKDGQWVIKGGAETVFQKFLAIRGGGSYSLKRKQGQAAGGIAFYGPRLQIGYSLERGQAASSWQHAFAARLIF